MSLLFASFESTLLHEAQHFADKFIVMCHWNFNK